MVETLANETEVEVEGEGVLASGGVLAGPQVIAKVVEFERVG